ncbi:MAG TPA: DUF72 domain-containing protein [Chthonomonadales bacterium]|nr:DUF72 domain-containing protein [Chthonomonadales bacterium]
MGGLGTVRIGTSGWMYKDWRGIFYPQNLPTREWLSYYMQHFDTVEVNNTFYHLPLSQTFDRWREIAPAGFLYAVKASRLITHYRKLEDVAEPLQNLLERARRLGPHLGPMLYQLPPRWPCNLSRLREFLALLPTGLEHVFEFRDPSWCCMEVRDLLTERGIGFCIHDLHGFECPLWVTGSVAYIRFHGPGQARYTGRYDMESLQIWAERIDAYRRGGCCVYAYFNNDYAGHAITNARELRGLLEG